MAAFFLLCYDVGVKNYLIILENQEEPMKTDTIAAIATSMSNSGIGIIRISGQEALSIADKIYRSKNADKKLSDQKTHTIHYGFIYDGEDFIDEVIVLIMKGPHSYTAEDTVEIDCHGGIMVVNKILETVIKYGARIAEPGEFTKRAFLNGRIDLTKAEAVMDLIESQNDYALKSSANQLKGSIYNKISGFRSMIIHEIAFIESALDDPEHISLDGYPDKLSKIVDNLMKEMNQMLLTFQNGKILKEGIKTVILGKPNAGKSSLLNKLLGEERAIVTEIAGTTRDVLEQYINLDGIGMNIIDTAGIRDTEDIVEKIGVDKAMKQAEDADLLLYVVDSSKPLDQDDFSIMKLMTEKRSIILMNKSDLDEVVSCEDMKKQMQDMSNNNYEKNENSYYMNNDQIENDNYNEEIAGKIADRDNDESDLKNQDNNSIDDNTNNDTNNNNGSNQIIIQTSMKDDTGLDILIDSIKKLFINGKIEYNNEANITNIRHKEALSDAFESLKLVKQSLEDEMPEDFLSIDLMNAYTSLGKIIGEEVEDDLVNEIFSKFCMGK